MDPRQRKKLEELYKKKNFQQISLEEYAVMRRERAKREQRRLPKPIKYLFAFITISVFIVCGIFFLYIVFSVIVNWK